MASIEFSEAWINDGPPKFDDQLERGVVDRFESEDAELHDDLRWCRLPSIQILDVRGATTHILSAAPGESYLLRRTQTGTMDVIPKSEPRPFSTFLTTTSTDGAHFQLVESREIESREKSKRKVKEVTLGKGEWAVYRVAPDETFVRRGSLRPKSSCVIFTANESGKLERVGPEPEYSDPS